MNITALKTVCRFLFDEILRHVIVLAIFAGIGLASPAKAVDGSITAYFPAAGLTKTVFIPIAAQSGGYTGDDTPEVSAGWISCPKRGGITSGSYAVAQCVITVEPNSSSQSRSGTVQFLFSGKTYLVNVIQYGSGNETQSKFALCVGINKYSLDGANDLDGCVNDANYFKSSLVSRGGWIASNTKVLTDSNATRMNISRAICEYAARAIPGDTFVWTQSSHGSQINGTYVAICGYDEFHYDKNIAQELALFPSGVKMVILVDTCHSGGMFKGVRSDSMDLARNVSEWMDRNELAVRAANGGDAPSRVTSSEIGWVTAADYDETSKDGGRYDDDAWLSNWAYSYYNAKSGVCGGAFSAAFLWGWWNGKADTTGVGDKDGYFDAYEGWKYAKTILVNFLLSTPQYLNDSVLREVELGTCQSAPTVSSVTITGDSSVAAGSGAQYACKANWSDGTQTTVTSSATWSISSGSAYASVSSSGYLSANYSTAEHTVVVKASYGGRDATKSVSITVATQTVTFNANGGSCSTSTQNYTVGGTYSSLPTPTRTGYSFSGWYTSSSGGTRITTSSTVTSSSTRTLYAQWTANTYSVSYNYDGGTKGSNNPSSATFGTAFYVSAPTKGGATFAGWTVASGLNASTAKWGSSSSPSTAISSSGTMCANGTTGNVYFLNLTPNAGGSVQLKANWTAASTPATPAGVSASQGTHPNKVVVSWSASAGAATYGVFRQPATSTSSTYDLLANGLTSCSYSDTSATSGIHYRYIVAAFNGAGQRSAYSSPVEGWTASLADSDLAEGMNATNLVFTSGGNAEWIAVLSPAHDGALAVQSGDIGSSQSSWMQTTVVGPALVSFWWNVSSETSYDKLTFAVDGATKGTISGTGGTWRKRKALLGPGTHTLRWTYAKDSSDDAGSDCGWVDQLSIQPWPERAGYHTSPSLFVGTLDSPLDHGDYFAPNGESGFSWDQLDSGRWVAYVFGSGDPSVLQTVLDQAEEGDIVAVWPGCYDPITVAVDNVSIVAIGSREETFINARYADRCATFDNAPNSYLDGFTLVQGYAEDGGGISGGKAWDCLVAGCEAIGDGGGAYRTTLTDCRLLANVAGNHGGGAYGGSLNRCELRGNEAGVWGGGIDNCSATGCLVAHNSAYKGGGADESTLMNCTVADNEADASFGGVWYCTVRNSIVSGNTAPFAANWGDDQNHTTFSYSCTYPVPPGAGNFNVNPNFVDRASGNYHLSNYSRCRDKGNRNLTKAPYDLAGLDRVMGANIDVGCYEYATQVTPLDPADYDGDGVPDIGFYNPATGTWFLRKTSDGEVRREKLGFSGITVVPRDYDGDGVRDPAIYNPASGYWQILQSTTGAVAVKKLGWKGITLVDAADCDGDGKADPIICNPASKTWQVLRSSDGGTTIVPNFGWAGIKPACGDYDGDGRAELAFYSPTSCTWYVRWRDGTQTSLKLGVAGARVFPLDADFDGALDPCYFNPSTGKWTWKSLGTGAGETVKFGDSTVTPHPFDWDGDGVPDTFGFYSPYRAGFLDLYLAPDGTRSAYMVNF